MTTERRPARRKTRRPRLAAPRSSASAHASGPAAATIPRRRRAHPAPPPPPGAYPPPPPAYGQPGGTPTTARRCRPSRAARSIASLELRHRRVVHPRRHPGADRDRPRPPGAQGDPASRGALTGDGMALAGIILGAVSLVLWLVYLVVRLGMA